MKLVAYFGIADWIGMLKETRETPKRKGRFCGQSAASDAHPFLKLFRFNIWPLKVFDNE